MKKDKTLIVIGIFVIIALTTAVSFALFTYTRTGITKTTITTGDIEFSYFENKDNVEISNAYPLKDSIGAKDTAYEYKFEVGLKSTSSMQSSYNVILLSDNNDSSKSYFKNNQIKYTLLKSEDDNVYVEVVNPTDGVYPTISEIDGFNEEDTYGSGVVLANQNIRSNQVQYYKLRIWISDDVNYSNTIDGQDEQESVGKYNGYSYSLKVRITTTNFTDYKPWTLAIDKNKNRVADLGDTVRIADENFYVYDNSNGVITAISYYNLNVGNNKVAGVEGIQNANAIGWNADASEPYYGTIPYTEIPQHLAFYKNYLEKQGVNIINIRSIEKGEINNIANNGHDIAVDVPFKTNADNNKVSWLYTSSYWLETQYEWSTNWCMNTNCAYCRNVITLDYLFGVRPVIVFEQ